MGGDPNGAVYEAENGTVLSQHRPFYFAKANVYLNIANVYLDFYEFYFAIGKVYLENGNVYLDEANVYLANGNVYSIFPKFYFADGDVYFANGKFRLDFADVRVNIGVVRFADGEILPATGSGSFDGGVGCFAFDAGGVVFGGVYDNTDKGGMGHDEVGFVGGPVGVNRALEGLEKPVGGFGKKGRKLIKR